MVKFSVTIMCMPLQTLHLHTVYVNVFILYHFPAFYRSEMTENTIGVIPLKSLSNVLQVNLFIFFSFYNDNIIQNV